MRMEKCGETSLEKEILSFFLSMMSRGYIRTLCVPLGFRLHDGINFFKLCEVNEK